MKKKIANGESKKKQGEIVKGTQKEIVITKKVMDEWDVERARKEIEQAELLLGRPLTTEEKIEHLQYLKSPHCMKKDLLREISQSSAYPTGEPAINFREIPPNQKFTAKELAELLGYKSGRYIRETLIPMYEFPEPESGPGKKRWLWSKVLKWIDEQSRKKTK